MSLVINQTRSLALALILGLAVIPSGWAEAQSQKPGPKAGSDYWRGDPKQRRQWGPEPMGPIFRSRMVRQRAFMRSDIPPQYLTMRNPLARSDAIIKKGKAIYALKCESCHGTKGLGAGEAGRGLAPSPAILGFMVRQPTSVDAYLMWTIAEGGQRFGTAMPAFKTTLKIEEIWSAIIYMRAGFPN